MPIRHEEAVIAQSQQVRRQSPHSYAAWLTPGLAAIRRLALQRLARIHLVVIANVRNERAVFRFDRMQFMVAVRSSIALACRDFRQPRPCLAVILGFANADLLIPGPELLACVQKASVAELNGSVRTVHKSGNSRGPGFAPICRPDQP